MTDEQKSEARRLKLEIASGIESASIPQAGGARLAIVVKLLSGYPMRGIDEATAEARAEAYSDALDDIAPFAVQAAARAWHRGEGDGNHDFAPSPARLRAMALVAMEPHQKALAHLGELLTALPAERAMDPAPLPAPTDPKSALIPRLRTVNG